MTTLHTLAPAAAPAALGRAPNTHPDPYSMHHATHAAPAPAWTIEAITPSTLADASRFVNASRRELFPALGHDALLDDARVLEESCVLVARSAGSIVAAIAYTPFDYRFAHLPFPLGAPSATPPSTASSSSSSLHASACSSDRPCRTVEVVRLFVLPQFRRHGLAAALFKSLQDRAIASGVQCMYLHTHPFLPGAIRFWEKQGFNLVSVDDQDEVWRTHHMQMMLSKPSSPST
ncbi:acetyltransferase [Stagonosporopsis vannaccii]|nr:acetyltransferase [Stagonosporopsis vannaccii]